jgi:NAD(P)H-hydrate epimerase
MKFVTTGEMLKWEEGKDHLELMEHAGKAVAEELEKLVSQGKVKNVVFVCGSGNNGGDCFTAARYLPGSKVFVAKQPAAREAKTNYEKLGEDRFVNDFHGFDCIVDCLLGIGVKGELREPVKSMVQEINEEKQKGVFVVSVDVPTGLGTSLEVNADLTVCLQFAKQGMQGKNFVVKKI